MQGVGPRTSVATHRPGSAPVTDFYDPIPYVLNTNCGARLQQQRWLTTSKRHDSGRPPTAVIPTESMRLGISFGIATTGRACASCAMTRSSSDWRSPGADRAAAQTGGPSMMGITGTVQQGGGGSKNFHLRPSKTDRFSSLATPGKMGGGGYQKKGPTWLETQTLAVLRCHLLCTRCWATPAR